MKLLSSLLLVVSTPLFAVTNLTKPPFVLEHSVERKGDNYVYDFYLTNNSKEPVRDVEYGSDCRFLTIPLDKAPVKDGSGGSPAIQYYSSPLKDVELSINAPSDSLSSPTSFKWVAEKRSAVTAGQKALIFSFAVPDDRDSAYLHRPYCVRQGAKEVSGVSLPKDWSKLNAATLITPVTEDCAKQIPAFDSKVAINLEFRNCTSDQNQLAMHRATWIQACTEQRLLEERLAHLDAYQGHEGKDAVSKSLTDQIADRAKAQDQLKQSIDAETVSLKDTCEGVDTPIKVVAKWGGCSKENQPEAEGIRVAIVGSKDFDVRRVDLSTVYIHGIRPDAIMSRDVGYAFDCSEQKDGFEDVSMFLSSKYVQSLFGDMVEGQEYKVSVRAVLFGGRPADRAIGEASFIYHKNPVAQKPS